MKLKHVFNINQNKKKEGQKENTAYVLSRVLATKFSNICV